MAELDLSFADVVLIIHNGTFSRARYSRHCYQLPDSPFLELKTPGLGRLRNLVVVLSADCTLVSVYNKDHRFREGVLK